MPSVSWERLWIQPEQDTVLHVDESIDPVIKLSHYNAIFSMKKGRILA